jgi:hypothetical protein
MRQLIQFHNQKDIENSILWAGELDGLTEEEIDNKTVIAQYPGWCPISGTKIKLGDKIFFSQSIGKWIKI